MLSLPSTPPHLILLLTVFPPLVFLTLLSQILNLNSRGQRQGENNMP